MAASTRSRRQAAPSASKDLENSERKPLKRKADDVPGQLRTGEENGMEGFRAKSSKSSMITKDTEKRQRPSASDDPRPAATKLDPHQTRKHAGPVRGAGSQPSTTNRKVEAASKAGVGTADGREQANKPVVPEKPNSHGRVQNVSGKPAAGKAVAAPLAATSKPNPFAALLAEVDASAVAAKANNAAKSSSLRDESLSARPEGGEQGARGDTKQTAASTNGGHDRRTDRLPQGDKHLPRGRSASNTSPAPSRPQAPPVKTAEREVHLSNYDGVCDLIKLLQKERHIIDAKAKGGAPNRPQNMRFDRTRETVNWELGVLREQQSILKSLPAEDAIDPDGYPKAFLRYKAGSAFPFQTPLDIGPLYTTVRLSHATKADIKSTFRADTWHGIAACIAWIEEQIEDLKSSPLHHNPKARKGPRESMFLEDAKSFKRSLVREKREMQPPPAPSPPPPPPMPAPKIDETSAKHTSKTESTDGKGNQPPKDTSLDAKSSAPTRNSQLQGQRNDASGEGDDVDKAVNDEKAVDDDSDGWVTPHINYSPEPSSGGPRTSSPSPSSSPSPGGPEQEREYTPYSPLSPGY